MSDQSSADKSFIQRMQETFRLVIYKADDFRELRTMNLNLGTIYIGISMLSILLIALFFSLFAFTPLKKMIPGFGEIQANEKFIQLIEGVDELSVKIDAQQTYLNAFGKLLTASAEVEPNTAAVANDALKDSQSKVPAVSSQIVKAPKKTTSAPAQDGNKSNDKIALYTSLRESEFIRPVDGVISSHFSPEISHYGIDILAPKNTPVKAMMDGFTIGVQHEGNILSFYKHNSILLKEKGTFVRAGEALAIIGNTGTLSNGPHLHFELWHSGKPVNPEEFINFN